MKRRVVLSMIAALLAACGSSAAHSAASDGTQASTGGTTARQSGTGGSTTGLGVVCGPSAARTLAASSQARVYLARGQAFGCARGGSRSFLLGRRGSCLGGARIAPVAVNGVLTAYGSERCGVDTGSSAVVVRRLTDGIVVSQQAASGTSAGAESYTMVSALVLARDGAVAWISTSRSIVGGHSATQVHAFDRHGLRLLDQGRAIDSAHLRLQALKVSWKHGGAWRSAKLA